MKVNALLFLLLLCAACNPKPKSFTEIENQYQLVDGQKQIVSQKIKTITLPDSLTIATRTKVYNYTNDIRIKTLTGYGKEDGLQDYLLDSSYYGNLGKDTLKKAFVRVNHQWQPVQLFHKKFRTDGQVSYSMTERPYNKQAYYKEELFYTYSPTGKLLEDNEIEVFKGFRTKKRTVYNSAGKIDSTFHFKWENNQWKKLDLFNKNRIHERQQK